ncbi:uncharacterized protein LOC127860738 isoform X2 [Dreissena polymorpha]|uniref:uncharacterized protein LOC127860738 isoform X2 n=1 Tax=Dreissena polymorpha TaxID=45954 RepID=UPI002263D4F1|nr:uncharacterized protein LOC127860738 isoform X2 [Dreissena polymorpha]
MAFFGIYLLSLLFILLHTWKRETGKGAVRRSNYTSIPAKTYLAPANNPVSCLPPKCPISCLPTNSLSSCLPTNSLSSCLSPPAIDSANGLQTNSPAINPTSCLSVNNWATRCSLQQASQIRLFNRFHRLQQLAPEAQASPESVPPEFLLMICNKRLIDC